MRLLVVDDSPTIRKVVELTFRGAGFSLDYAASGREGIDAALGTPPDVVLLDFVLPDMRGLDVCARLAADERTRDVPILILSAKDESVRRLFAPYPSVVDFVKKPFTGDDLLARVRTATADEEGRPRPTRAPERFSREQREQAAKAMFGVLRQAFAHIPSWCAQMGANPAAPFFARKLLTPDVMADVLEALAPMLAKPKTTPPRPRDGAALEGVLNDWSLSEFAGLLGGSGRTGELRVDVENERTILYLRAGELVMVTSHDAEAHTGGDGRALHAPPDVRAQAASEQVATGKPVPVTLAEAGHWGDARDLAHELHRSSNQILRRTLAARPASFAWSDLRALPPWVAAHGRYVAMPRDTLLFGAAPANDASPTSTSLHGLALDLARAASQDAEASWPRAEQVLDRVRGFSGRMKSMSLDASERRVLATVTGRATLREAAARSQLGENETRRVAHVLVEAGLLVAVAGTTRAVLIVEPDVEGFQRQLEGLLARRSEPVPLVSFEAEDDLVAAALRERPSLVILNAGAARDAERAARTLRSHGELASVPLIAVLDLPERARAPELAAVGFDAVLVKPVAYADLEKLIGL